MATAGSGKCCKGSYGQIYGGPKGHFLFSAPFVQRREQMVQRREQMVQRREQMMQRREQMMQRREKMAQRREQMVQRREQMVQRREHYYVAMATCLETVTRQPTGAGYILFL